MAVDVAPGSLGSFDPKIVCSRQRLVDRIDELVLSLSGRELTGVIAARLIEGFAAKWDPVCAVACACGGPLGGARAVDGLRRVEQQRPLYHQRRRVPERPLRAGRLRDCDDFPDDADALQCLYVLTRSRSSPGPASHSGAAGGKAPLKPSLSPLSDASVTRPSKAAGLPAHRQSDRRHTRSRQQLSAFTPVRLSRPCSVWPRIWPFSAGSECRSHPAIR